ncbi:hypothetical protein F5146DRAFT_1122100 [Armillaria mellea]|nr:hypothetical protein F5146DRAFT_1122100 [Armillaria mellea]
MTILLTWRNLARQPLASPVSSKTPTNLSFSPPARASFPNLSKASNLTGMTRRHSKMSSPPIRTSIGSTSSRLQVPQKFPPMKPFIDLAVQKGVKRFVLLSASALEPGQPAMGKVHEYRSKSITQSFVLRGFLRTFSTLHLSTIKEQNTILSASADGKIGFISADDIADLAVSTLTDEKSHNTDYILTGPELLSYDDVAAIFSEVHGRKITHTRITVEELKKRYLAFGLPEDYAEMLSSLDDLNANGVEERLFVAPKKVAGKRTLRSFVEANKDLFRPWMYAN